MEVKVTIAGNEMSIPVTPEQETELKKKYEIQFMANFFRETSREIRHEANFTTEETDCLVDTLFHAYFNPQELCEAIIAGTYFKQVEEMADGIVKERARIYEVTIKYEGEFTVRVKARDEDDALDAISDLSQYDLLDHMDKYDTEFDAYRATEDFSACEDDIDFYADGCEV